METTKEVLSILRSLESEEDDNFPSALRLAIEHFQLSDKELANDMHISLPTLRGWKEGTKLPFRLMRRPILNHVASGSRVNG